MDFEVKKVVVVAIGLFMLIRGYISLFSKGKPYKAKFIERAKKKGNVRVARYVDSVIRGRSYDTSKSEFVRNNAYIVKYEYEVGGKKYYKKITYQELGSVSCRYPLEVKVYFDERNPRKAYCENEIDVGTRKSLGCFGSILVTMFVMWIITSLL